MSASDGNTAELWVPTGSVTVRVPGKVNLYLAVGDRREDGYHELTTVFHAVSLVDEVTVRNADVLSLELVGEGADQLPTDERNLAWQAAELMAEHVGRAPDVSIMIDKSIPVAGGMAGGSADAAAVLVAMNSLWELNVPRRDLRMLAARLGSDVPFALHGGTALGTGRGEELATVLSRNTFHWVLAFADSGLLTSAVYNELDRLREVDPPRLGEPGPVLAALAAGDPDQLAPLLGNEMQAAAVSLDPALARALRAGVEAGALAGIVSGSGPTCAFLCTSASSAIDVGAQLSGAEFVAPFESPPGRYPAPAWCLRRPKCDRILGSMPRAARGIRACRGRWVDRLAHQHASGRAAGIRPREVGGAHQSQAQKPYHDATEPLGESLRYRPAHGDSCINGHRDNPSARESSQFTAGSTAKAVTKL